LYMKCLYLQPICYGTRHPSVLLVLLGGFSYLSARSLDDRVLSHDRIPVELGVQGDGLTQLLINGAQEATVGCYTLGVLPLSVRVWTKVVAVELASRTLNVAAAKQTLRAHHLGIGSALGSGGSADSGTGPSPFVTALGLILGSEDLLVGPVLVTASTVAANDTLICHCKSTKG